MTAESAQPAWRGHSLAALRESEVRVASAYAELHEFSASIQGKMEALKDQIRVSEMTRNEELAKLLALEPASDYYDEDWRPDPEELVVSSRQCPDSPTGHCIYDDEGDANHDYCLICDCPSERK